MSGLPGSGALTAVLEATLRGGIIRLMCRLSFRPHVFMALTKESVLFAANMARLRLLHPVDVGFRGVEPQIFTCFKSLRAPMLLKVYHLAACTSTECS
jgi:hypothetical protein